MRIDPAALRRARRRLEDHVRDLAEVDAVTLLRLAGEGELDAGDAVDRRGATPTWTDALLGGLPDEQLAEEHEPATFRGELRPYQRRGLAWLRFLDRLGLGGCLADDMGLGKTATTLAHLLDRPGPHLVDLPAVGRPQLGGRGRPLHAVAAGRRPPRRRAGADGASSTGADLVVTTYGLLARDVEHLAAVDWSTVVADEAQMIKNPATHAAKALRALRAGQKLALTGTPVENRLAELWAILDAVNPGMLGSRERFRQRFAKPIERDGDGEAAARLRRMTQPFVLRRTKADRSLVPGPARQDRAGRLGRPHPRAGRRSTSTSSTNCSPTPRRPRAGCAAAGSCSPRSTRLKQICNHPAHVLGDGSRLAGRSGKLARFDELVDELLDVDERALVFTQFREMGELLVRHLARAPRAAPSRSSTAASAEPAASAWSPTSRPGVGAPLLLVSLKAGGTGLNLTAASQVIHYDRWWNPAVEDQATDRAWRIGQGRTVIVHKLVCEGTVEERIAAIIDQKRALADAVVGGGEAWLSELSTAELRELVRLDGIRHDDARVRLVTPHPQGRLPAAMLRALAAELSDPGRFSRAKAYARDGAVIDIVIEPGEARGEVQGSRYEPYVATIYAAPAPIDEGLLGLIPERTS